VTDAWLEPLAAKACLRLLQERAVCRVAVVVDGDPINLPVNYRLVEPPTGAMLVVRTRFLFWGRAGAQPPMSAPAARRTARSWSMLTSRTLMLAAAAIAAAVPAASPVAIAAGISLVAWCT